MLAPQQLRAERRQDSLPPKRRGGGQEVRAEFAAPRLRDKRRRDSLPPQRSGVRGESRRSVLRLRPPDSKMVDRAGIEPAAS